MGKSKIRSKRELRKALRVRSLGEITKNERARHEFLERLPDIDPELAITVLKTMPKVAKSLADAIESTAKVSKNLSEASRQRWIALCKMIECGDMSADQTIEMAQTITETERVDSEGWRDTIKYVCKSALAAVATVALATVAIVLGKNRKSK